MFSLVPADPDCPESGPLNRLLLFWIMMYYVTECVVLGLISSVPC